MVDKAALTAALAAVSPCVGVTCPDPTDRSTWRVDFDPAPTDAQRQAAAGVIVGWADPAPSPAVSGDAIIGAIAKADRAKCDPTDLARIAWRDDVPASNPKLGRVAKALGTTPDALRAAAAG